MCLENLGERSCSIRIQGNGQIGFPKVCLTQLTLREHFLKNCFILVYHVPSETITQDRLCIYFKEIWGRDTLRPWVSQASAMEWLIIMFLEDCVLFFSPFICPQYFGGCWDRVCFTRHGSSDDGNIQKVDATGKQKQPKGGTCGSLL